MCAKDTLLAAAGSACSKTRLSPLPIHERFMCMMWIGAALLFTCRHTDGQSDHSQNMSAAPSQVARRATLALDYGKLPLSFEANRGQSDPQVRFLSRGSGYSLFLTDKEAVLALTRPGKQRDGDDPGSHKLPQGGMLSLKTDVLRMQLAGASPGLKVSGVDKLPGTANYFIGNDPKEWRSDVPTFRKVEYEAVYPGVDLVYYGNQRQLEYDFVVAPYAEAKPIHLHFDGAKKLRLGSDGDLDVITRNGWIAFHKPAVYQDIDGQRRPIDGRFILLAKNTVGFSLGSYDRAKAVVIDPTLSYSTYLGGSGQGDSGQAITVDALGFAYIAGYTTSSDFPTTPGSYNPVGTTQTGGAAVSNAFIAKLNLDGSGLIYSTYLGGKTYTSSACFGGYYGGSDEARGIAIDDTGDAYVTGCTSAVDFPVTTGAYQTALNGFNNAFVTELDPDGAHLIYSTYLGGGGEIANAIALDSENNAYVAGSTGSDNFPVTPGAYQTTRQGSTAFITKLNPSGTGLVYSTFLGGNGADPIDSIALDGGGSAYVTGTTASTTFPVTPAAFQLTNNEKTANGFCPFVAKLDTSGSILLYATYLGGSGGDGVNDSASGIAVDEAGYAYVTGTAGSKDFPTTTGAFQTTNNTTSTEGTNAFVTELNLGGTGLVYSTFLGGTAADSGSAITIDLIGNAYVTGNASSSNFPTTNDGFQRTLGPSGASGNPAFLAELNPEGTQLSYSTFIGGTAHDYGLGVAVDLYGNAYLVGRAESTNFPITPGAFQQENKSGYYGLDGNAFVAKFSLAPPIGTTTSITSDANPQVAASSVTFTAFVQAASGTGIPTGSVTFSIDGGAGDAVTLDDTGHASYATSSLTAGVHTVTASYSGNANYSVSSGTLIETIIGAAASIAPVSGFGQTTAYGSAFSSPLVVIVKDSNGNPVPGATVSFSGPGLTFSSATATTGSNGEASVSATAGAAGALTAAASTSGITGSANFALTATAVALTVTANNANVPYGRPIPALTYAITGFVNGDTVSAVTGAPSETTTAAQGSSVGTYPITLLQGTLASANYSFQFVSGTLTITSLGTAATPTFLPAAGVYTAAQSVAINDVTAGATIHYTTDGSMPTENAPKYVSAIPVNISETISAIASAPGYADSPMATAVYTINLPAASFALTASPSSMIITSERPASFTLTVTPENGFTQPVSFACSGMPSEVGCTFSPSTVTPNGAAVTSTMTIALGTSARGSARPRLERIGGGLALALLLWPLRRRRIHWICGFVCLAILGSFLTGCGGSPKSQTATVTITATGGSVIQSTTVNLTVKY